MVRAVQVRWRRLPRGLFNVRTIRPAPGAPFPLGGATFVPYYFDADVALEGFPERTPGVGILGWLQTAPIRHTGRAPLRCAACSRRKDPSADRSTPGSTSGAAACRSVRSESRSGWPWTARTRSSSRPYAARPACPLRARGR